MERLLILEDGSVYRGTAFGSDNFQIGELVFNTSMTGYQEILTDNSYCGQIVMMTYPLIGNYGINRDDNESMVPGIYDIDTREITMKIRNVGTMKAVMADVDANVDAVVAGLKAADFLHDQVARVSTNKVFPIPNRGKKVVLMDFGAKLGIVRELSKRGCDLVIVPYDTPASTILSYRPDGVMLSNGPGDPTDVKVAIETIKELIPQTVVFGICLGHQLISLACGAKTYKLKFGHRGANHPVVNLSTGKVEITSQNHGFAVDIDSLKDTRLEMTHQALNDKSCEGVRHKDYPCFAVQYHPEASAGPEDSRYLFDQFIELMEENKNA